MESNTPLARASYFIALLLVILPISDQTLNIWPLRLDQEQWRFGAVGSLGNVMLVPLFGLLIAVATAVMFDHRRTRRVLGWITALLAVTLAALLVLFVLDYLQARTQVRVDLQHMMGVASANSITKQILTILGMVLLSVAGLSGPKTVTRTRDVRKTDAATPLIPLTNVARSE